MVKETPATGPSDEALEWLIMGLWSWSPEPHADRTAKSMNTTSLVELHSKEIWRDDEKKEFWDCTIRHLNKTEDKTIEFCYWEVEGAQLRISLPDDWATTFHINSKFGTLSQHDGSYLTKTLNFDDLERTYNLELLLEGQWGWSSHGKEPMNAYISFDRNHTCWFLQALNATLYPERGDCEWEVVLSTTTVATPEAKLAAGEQLAQLKLHLDDKWMQNEGGHKFADPLGYKTDVDRPAWINKVN